VVHDLHLRSGVDASNVSEQFEVEAFAIVERAHHVGDVARADGDFGRVRPLANGAVQLVAELLLEIALETSVRRRAPL
jgi:hypothetical protein